MKKLASWNVNGIRACVKKGFSDWVKKNNFDIFCLQETKADEEQFPKEVFDLGYKVYSSSAVKKGYSGVAVFSKKEPIKVTSKLGIKKFDDEGRTLICEFENFILINGYYPNGQRDLGRVDFKLEYSEAILQLSKKLQKKTSKEIILCGDFNTAHHPIDLANPKTNTNTTGFLEIERNWMTRLENNGFTDIFRKLHPDEEKHYTWWTYRGDCRTRNIGWRIDYFFISEGLNKLKLKSYHQPQVLGSDHCPIVLEANIK